MLSEYKGDLDLKSKKELQYPGAPNKKQRIQDAVEGPITDTIRELGLKTVHEYSRICRKLKQYGRVPVPIDGHKEGCNGPLKAVLVQLNIPQGYKTNMFRHWIVSYMAENVSYFHPRMRSYLKRHNMYYNSYLWQVFNGSIWTDRYMLGAITRMLNVTISIVTPASGLVWNVYHDSATPDIVLIANGVDFEKGITHISATKGEEKMWHCVGYDSSVGEIARFLGESEGVRQAIAIFTISDNYEVLVKMQKFLGDLEEACEDLKNLCIRRDQMLKQLNVIGVDSKGLSRFKRYSVVESLETAYEDDVSQENFKKALDKSGEDELSRKSDPLESTQKVLKRRKKSIDVSTRQSTMGMKTIQRIMQTEPKQKPKQQLPSLPSDFTVPDIITMSDIREKKMIKYCEDREEGEIMDVTADVGVNDDNMSEGSENNLLNQSLNPVQDHEYCKNDIRIEGNQKSITIRPVNLTAPKSVITEQPQSIKGNLPRYEDLSGNVSDDTQCVYGESDMIVSKKVAEFLEGNYVPGQIDPPKEKKKKRKREKSLDESVVRHKDENVLNVRVHTTGIVQSGPSVTRQKDKNVSTVHVHRTGMVQSGPSVGRQKDEKFSSFHLHTTGMVQSGPSVTYQKDGNVSSVNVHTIRMVQNGPNVTRQKDRNVSTVHVDTTGIVKSGPSVGRRKDENVLTDNIHTTGMIESGPSVARQNDENVSTVHVHTRGMVQSAARQKDENVSTVHVHKTGMIQKSTSVRQYIPPIPIKFEEVGYVYCNKCPAKYKSKYQLKKHWLRVCPGNLNKEVLICTHCSKTFKWEHNLKDHITTHTGGLRHHCKVSNCGQSFRYQKEFGRHTVNVHGQVQKTEEFIDEDSDEDSE